ncbi:hypothetical protein K502DRAFT_369053 [Neoconidiobolus thromboides FSU 785]|nr:hypothetical protein K502DRAFT_369053 [Neoconidiobolus thromboides FSU 785]
MEERLLDSGVIVIDTNFFINDGNYFKEIVNLGQNYNLIVIVPFIVLQELDHLKMTKKLAAKDYFKLLSSIKNLSRYVFEGHPVIRGQKREEKIKEEAVNDDKILDCCIYFKNNVYQNSLVTLLSHDRLLCTKAMIHDINFLDIKGLTPKEYLIKLGIKNNSLLLKNESQYLQETINQENYFDSPPPIKENDNLVKAGNQGDYFDSPPPNKKVIDSNDNYDTSNHFELPLSSFNENKISNYSGMYQYDNDYQNNDNYQYNHTMGHFDPMTTNKEVIGLNRNDACITYIGEEKGNKHLETTSIIRNGNVEVDKIYDKKGFIITKRGLVESRWSDETLKNNKIQIERRNGIEIQTNKGIEIEKSKSIANQPEALSTDNNQLLGSKWSSVIQNISNNQEIRANKEDYELSKLKVNKITYSAGDMPKRVADNPNKKRTELQNNSLELLTVMLNYSERELSTLLMQYFKQKNNDTSTSTNMTCFNIIKIIDIIILDNGLKSIFTKEQLENFLKLEPIILEYQRMHMYGICNIYLKQVDFVYQQLLILFKLFEKMEEKEKLHQRFMEVCMWLKALEYLKNS